MSWIIALGLLFWLGMSICKMIDKTRGAIATQEIERYDKTLINRDAFLANIYVVSWHHYQQLEQRVIKAWYGDENFSHVLHPGVEMEMFSRQVFGEPISLTAIKQAISELKAENIEWYLENPDPNGRAFVCKRGSDIDATNRLAFALKEDIPELGNEFDWEFANHANCLLAIRNIPDRGDERAQFMEYSYTLPNGKAVTQKAERPKNRKLKDVY